ncbi:hypothetical protein UF75_5426 [Desulfosporosinus sp. I2]|nr:hypothetical protein UF75_5426 [Desulfosporosinus sp. I2]
MDGTLLGSIIELIMRLGYDEKEKLILTVQNIMSNSTEGNAKLIGELREKKSIAKVSVALIAAALMLFDTASSKVASGINVRTA